MVNFDKIRSEITFAIRANRKQEISGTVLQKELLKMVDAIEDSVKQLAEDLSLNQEQVNEALAAIVQSLTLRIDDVNSAVTAEITNRKAADEQITKELGKKVNAVEGKGLSSNDFTDLEKEKLARLQNYDDSGLRKALSDESKTRQEEDAKLSKLISNEAQTRQSADESLRKQIQNEAEVRSQTDTNFAKEVKDLRDKVVAFENLLTQTPFLKINLLDYMYLDFAVLG